jgi:hypothetical protein
MRKVIALYCLLFCLDAVAITATDIRDIEALTEQHIKRDPRLKKHRNQIIDESIRLFDTTLDEVEQVIYVYDKGLVSAVGKEVGRAVVGAVVGEIVRRGFEAADRPSKSVNTERPSRPNNSTASRSEPTGHESLSHE